MRNAPRLVVLASILVAATACGSQLGAVLEKPETHPTLGGREYLRAVGTGPALEAAKSKARGEIGKQISAQVSASTELYTAQLDDRYRQEFKENILETSGFKHGALVEFDDAMTRTFREDGRTVYAVFGYLSRDRLARALRFEIDGTMQEIQKAQERLETSARTRDVLGVARELSTLAQYAGEIDAQNLQAMVVLGQPLELRHTRALSQSRDEFERLAATCALGIVVEVPPEVPNGSDAADALRTALITLLRERKFNASDASCKSGADFEVKTTLTAAGRLGMISYAVEMAWGSDFRRCAGVQAISLASEKNPIRAVGSNRVEALGNALKKLDIGTVATTVFDQVLAVFHQQKGK